MDRRKFITITSVGATAMALGPIKSQAGSTSKTINVCEEPVSSFWLGNVRLARTISMQFEAGGQPISGASGLIPEPVLAGYSDLRSGDNGKYWSINRKNRHLKE